jgi:hypothetical protein
MGYFFLSFSMTLSKLRLLCRRASLFLILLWALFESDHLASLSS